MTPDEIQAAISRAVEAVVAKYSLDENTRRFVPGGKPEPETDGKSGFKSFGEWLATVRFNPVDRRLKALSEGSDSAGGFTVPAEFRNSLLQIAKENAIIRPRATVIPMGTDKISITKIAETSHASHLFGGVLAYWADEAAQYTASQPVFGKVELVAKKLIGYTSASDELLADSGIALEALLTQMFGVALAYYEDDAFINGNGVGKPLGFLNSGAVVEVAIEGAQGDGTIVAANINKMYSRMIPSSLPRAVWMANNDTLPQLLPLMDPLTTSQPVGAPGMTLRGRPVVLSEKLPTHTYPGDLCFVDLTYYLVGDRQSLAISRSEHVRFAYDEMVWKFSQRLDGQPWLDSAITPKTGSNTITPFVTLAERHA